MSTTMRAKMYIGSIKLHVHGDPRQVVSEELELYAVQTKKPDENGFDEDNSYAHWTPSASVKMIIQNPALFDKFKVGDRFYVDFTPAP